MVQDSTIKVLTIYILAEFLVNHNKLNKDQFLIDLIHPNFNIFLMLLKFKYLSPYSI